MATTTTANEKSLGQLLKDLTAETTTLLKQEVDLAKTEMGEKASRVGTNVGSVAVGGAVLFAGALALLFAAVNALTEILAHMVPITVAAWLSPLLLGIGLGLLGYSLVKKALATLKQESVTPRRTTQSLQENKEW
ncbi:MAG TPA: phage holin family protein, partial [Thermoanaerobaculia bacterium]|nr:phage holin family protein [Thermoanaerobaculia bacterium]